MHRQIRNSTANFPKLGRMEDDKVISYHEYLSYWKNVVEVVDKSVLQIISGFDKLAVVQIMNAAKSILIITMTS